MQRKTGDFSPVFPSLLRGQEFLPRIKFSSENFFWAGLAVINCQLQFITPLRLSNPFVKWSSSLHDPDNMAKNEKRPFIEGVFHFWMLRGQDSNLGLKVLTVSCHYWQCRTIPPSSWAGCSHYSLWTFSSSHKASKNLAADCPSSQKRSRVSSADTLIYQTSSIYLR